MQIGQRPQSFQTLQKKVDRSPTEQTAATETSVISGDQLEISASAQVAEPTQLLKQGQTTALSAALGATPGPQSTSIRVLTLNTYFDSNAGLESIENIIKTTKADLVGLQEVNASTKRLAESLGMHYVQQDKRTALLSKFPIKEVSPEKFGVKVELDNGRDLSFFNVHATSFPFQPAQIARKPSGGGPYINNEKDAIRWADWTRGDEFRSIISESDEFNLPTIVTGDFNEPSHLDWTHEAADAGLYKFKVDWPGSKNFEKAGFVDSWRSLNPDEIALPGRTWPADEPDIKPEDPNVRIDYIMHRGEELKLVSSDIVGESEETSDIVFEDYPSDHRALLNVYEVSGPG